MIDFEILGIDICFRRMWYFLIFMVIICMLWRRNLSFCMVVEREIVLMLLNVVVMYVMLFGVLLSRRDFIYVVVEIILVVVVYFFLFVFFFMFLYIVWVSCISVVWIWFNLLISWWVIFFSVVLFKWFWSGISFLFIIFVIDFSFICNSWNFCWYYL